MRKTILTIPIDWLTREELVRKLEVFLVSKKPHQITTVNAEFIVLSQHNKDFRAALQNSDLSLADGTGIVLAQTLQDITPQANVIVRWLTYITLGLRHVITPHAFSYSRITGVELTNILLQLSKEEKWTIYLLGAAPGVAEEAANIWREQFPGVVIVGATDDNPQDKHTLANIKETNPDILLVAYGAPKQDLFIAHHKNELKVPIMVGVGGTFDYAAGRVKLAPKWMRAIGLEWLARLVQQPKRFKRIYKSTITFSKLIVHAKT